MIRILLLLIFSALLSFNVSASDDFDSLFSLPEVSADSTTNLPYELNCKQDVNKVKCSIKLSSGAYIYADSFAVASDSARYSISSMADPVLHTDVTGNQQVFDRSFDFELLLNSAKQGSHIFISFRLCDKFGICYPVQKNSFVVTQSVLGNSSSQIKQDSFFSESDSLLFMILLSVVFGAALDLTPCVLPMLSIYSASILGCAFKNVRHTIILNLAYALGMTLSYSVLGLIFAQLGVMAHGILQHPVSIILISFFMVYLALDCLDIVKLKVPQLFNAKIEKVISAQKTGSAFKAFLFGTLCALIATPCTSAPLAGAILYVINTNSLVKGWLLFFSIGLGMAIPLVLVGVLGAKYLAYFKNRTNIVRNLLALPLLIGAYYVSRHLFAEYENLYFCSVTTICIVLAVWIFFRSKQLSIIIFSCILAGTVTFSSTFYFRNIQKGNKVFTIVKTLEDLEKYHGQKIILTFSAKWCSNCHALDSTVYSSEAFINATKDFSLLRFDITDTNSSENTKICKKFNVIGVPYLLVINEDGQVLRSSTGTVDTQKVLEMISN
ncbi:MAG: protein-disulfide reductase DsbD family protein [Succinivibrio sp.]